MHLGEAKSKDSVVTHIIKEKKNLKQAQIKGMSNQLLSKNLKNKGKGER